VDCSDRLGFGSINRGGGRCGQNVSRNSTSKLTTHPKGGSISLERAMSKLPKRLWHDESGQDLTEYALLVALIGLSAVVGMNSMAQAVSNVFTNAAANLSTAT